MNRDAQDTSDELHTVSCGRSVVLVEDDGALCEAVAFSLDVDGFAVQTYRTGADAEADPLLASRSCAIVDLGLPDTNGLTLIRRLRRLGLETPAILITSNPTPWVRMRAAADKVSIVEKPLLGDALVQAVRHACSSATL